MNFVKRTCMVHFVTSCASRHRIVAQAILHATAPETWYLVLSVVAFDW